MGSAPIRFPRLLLGGLSGLLFGMGAVLALSYAFGQLINSAACFSLTSLPTILGIALGGIWEAEASEAHTGHTTL